MLKNEANSVVIFEVPEMHLHFRQISFSKTLLDQALVAAYSTLRPTRSTHLQNATQPSELFKMSELL